VPIPVRRRTGDNATVMTPLRRVGRRAPLTGVIAVVLTLLLLPASAFGADNAWTGLKRVSDTGGSRLDSLHQLAADRGQLHLVHPRIGPNRTDDRIVYQRSRDNGGKWTPEQTVFVSSNKHRHVVPNLALDARGGVVALAFRVKGPEGDSLFVRTSRNDGATFGVKQEVFVTTSGGGIGVPAVAVGNDFVAVAWTDRRNGRIKLRVSRDDGRTFGKTKVLARTKLSIDCKNRMTDGLVGLAASDKRLHLAWSHAPKRACQASAIRTRTSTDRGADWSKTRTLTKRRTYGWPELDARGRTVVATVQSPTGGLVLARSGRNGKGWQDRLLKAPRGFSFSAADITLLPNKKALLTHVTERVKRNRLLNTKVVSRRSPDDGRSWNKPKTVADRAQRLRMAPNVAANSTKVSIVVQAGPLDGSPRNLFVSRLR
jgi:hypothetical protein